jgi:crotonobetainyl-CoA:carnitine CoA-transferase CaiB-like acyl-CoA transferase
MKINSFILSGGQETIGATDRRLMHRPYEGTLMNTPTSSPLAGVRVLDLTRILAGPWATQLLADLGAEIIKIERTIGGDDTRGWGPPYLDEDNDEHPFSAYFMSANRGKKSVAVDLGSPAGQEIIRGLAKEADILVENFKVGALQRCQLDYESLALLNPRLIYCSITGFGQTGPHKDKPGYDLLVQAMGGLMSITGTADGEPMKAGVAIADILTGLYSTTAILAAMNERNRSGLGQHIDLALLDVQIATLANQGMNYLASGRIPRRVGNAHPNIVPYQAFATQDGHLVVAVGNDSQFLRLASILGRPDLAQNPNYITNRGRVENRAPLIDTLTDAIREFSTADLLQRLEAEKIPAGRINDLDGVFSDPQIAARDLILQHTIPDTGKPFRMVGNPIKFSRTPIVYGNAPPRLGADTSEVMKRTLGTTDQELEQFEQQGIISTQRA